MSRTRVTLARAATVVVLAACGSSPSMLPHAGNGPISFSRFDPRGTHVYFVDPSGGQPIRLTDGPGTQAHSAWSPDGARATYTQVDIDGSSVMRIAADGTATTRLNKGAKWSMVPAWSPDGSRVAFTSDVDGNYEIYTMQADGGDVQQVTFTDPPTAHVGPKYSPDGSRILFALQRRKDAAKQIQDVWVMNVDGSSQKRLTHGYDNAESRAWSPDGRRITFNAVIDGAGQIFVMDSDGKALHQVTHNPGTTAPFVPGGIFPTLHGDVTPAWSPDGSRIAFASDRDGNFEIYTMHPDGTDMVRLTNTADQELSVGWSASPSVTP